jgi:adenine/guanine phosphoribosyltransferase-like PRPP-binding protein
VNHEEIWQILRNGGLTVERSDDEADAGYRLVGSFRPLTDPAGVDALGVMLAERAREFAPDIVIVGEGAKDLLLGFVVARELDRPLVRCLNLEGLVGAVGDIPEGSRAIFVADKIRKSGFVYAVGNLMDREGGELVGVVSWIYADAPELAVPWTGLVKPEEGLQES